MAKDDWVNVPVNQEDDWEGVPVKSPRTPMGESVLRGAAQSALLGLPDEATGALEATRDFVAGPTKLRDFVRQYRKRRDQSRANYDHAQRDNPMSYMSGEVAGALGSAFVPGLGALNTARAGTVVGRGGLAALQGAAAGFGASKDDMTTGTYGGTKGALEDTVVGAGMGLAGLGLGKKLGDVGRKVKKGLSEFSDWNTLKAGGAMTADRKALRYQGKTKGVADFMRKSGIVSFGSTVDDALERVAPVKEKAGKQIGDSLEMLDQHVAEAGGDVQGFSPRWTSWDIQHDVIAPRMRGFSEARSVGKRLRADARLLSRHGDSMTFADANNTKNDIYKMIKDYGKEKSPYIEGLKEFGGAFNKSMEGSADYVARAADDPKLLKTWLQSKKDFGNAATVEKMAANRSDQIKTNNPFGLTDYVLGGGAIAGGVTSGNPEQAAYALPLIMANKILRTRGASAAGISSQKLLQVLEGPNGHKISAMFGKALGQSPGAVAVTHRRLMETDEYYRKQMQSGK